MFIRRTRKAKRTGEIKKPASKFVEETEMTKTTEIETEETKPSNPVQVNICVTKAKTGKPTTHVVEDDGTIRCKKKVEGTPEKRPGTLSDVTCRKCRGEQRGRAVTASSDPKSDERVAQLRHAVRFAYDIQKMRISQGNRAGPQAEQTEAKLDEGQKAFLAAASARLHLIEQDAFAEVKRLLKGIPIYEEWLSAQKGVGATTAGFLVSSIDIKRANSPSSIWALCGLGVMGSEPSVVIANCYAVLLRDALHGKTRNDVALHVEQEGDNARVRAEVLTPYSEEGKDRRRIEVLGEVYKFVEANNWGASAYMESSTGVGQRRVKGEKANYNPWLKSKVIAVLGGCLIKAQSKPWVDFYYNYKTRKANQWGTCMLCGGTKLFEKKPCGNCKKVLPDGTEESTGVGPWGRSDAHRHQAAVRYMVKRFLVELYAQWRALEGLPVRVPYEVEYLHRKHHE